MTAARFLLCWCMYPDGHKDAHPARWRGMVKWYETRLREGYFNED
jgi:hypothetical protein